MPSVTVEEVDRGKGLQRFTEVPFALHGDDPRFAPLVLSWERFRVSRWRNPYLRDSTWALFLARRGGRPAGRIAAHVPPSSGPAGTLDGAVGRFGFWSCRDDAAVARALVGAATAWLGERGCTAMDGPYSFEPEDEPGLLVRGHEIPGTTGRPWSPAHESLRLGEALPSAVVASEERTWRLATTGAEPPPAAGGGPVPGQAGRQADPRLVLEGIAAVPDLSGALGSDGLRPALRAVRQARVRGWEGCTVVRCDDDPAVAVPALLAAAGGAGYRWAVTPWSPDPAAEPETVHRRLHVAL